MQLELYAEVCIVVLCGAKSQAFILVLSGNLLKGRRWIMQGHEMTVNCNWSNPIY